MSDPILPFVAAVARASKAARHTPTHANRLALDTARQNLAEEKLSAYVRRVVAKAPPLRPEQLDRLAQLVRPAVSRSEPAA